MITRDVNCTPQMTEGAKWSMLLIEVMSMHYLQLVLDHSDPWTDRVTQFACFR